MLPPEGQSGLVKSGNAHHQLSPQGLALPHYSRYKSPLANNSPEDLDVHQNLTINLCSLFCNPGKIPYDLPLKKVKILFKTRDWVFSVI